MEEKEMAQRPLRILALVPLLLVSSLFCGCNKTQDVLNALGITQQVITIAQDDLPGLQAAGILTQSDVTAAGNWLAGAGTLVTQAEGCVNTAGGTTAKLAACVNAIGQGLLSPAEQADLRIISPGAQKKVTLYVTAVILGVNAVAVIVNGLATPTPTVGTATTELPSKQDIRILALRAGATNVELNRIGY
jgi:hypothetical protein